MGVYPGDAEGELVDGGLADEFGAGVDQGLDGGGGGFGYIVGAQPFRAAGPGDEAGDVEQVLGAEGQPGEGALGRPGDVDLDVPAKGAKVIVHGTHPQAASGWRSGSARWKASSSMQASKMRMVVG